MDAKKATNVSKENKQDLVTNMKEKLSNILLAISWREFSNTYFEHSSSWFYHKMDGIDGNGGVGGFTKAEVETLRSSLMNLSERIRDAAQAI